jgi:NitT/TauT family transport system substrate-binding protein
MAAFAIIIAGIVFYTNQNKLPDPKPLQTKSKVRIGVNPITASLAVKVAEQKDLFSKYNIEPEIIEYQSSNQMTEGLIRNEIDVACCAAILAPLDSEIASPGKIKIFTAINDHDGLNWDNILVKNDSNIKTLSDLTAKKIALYPGSLATPVLKNYLSKSQVDTSKIEFVPLPAASHIAALESNSTDALFTYEPISTIAMETGKYRILQESVYHKLNPSNSTGAGYISTNFLSKNKALADSTIKVLDEAHTLIKNRDQSRNDTLTKWLKLDPKIAQKVQVPVYYENKDVNLIELQGFVDYLTEIGALKQKVNVTDIFYRAG